MKFSKRTKVLRHWTGGNLHFQYFGQTFLNRTWPDKIGMWIEYNPVTKSHWFKRNQFIPTKPSTHHVTYLPESCLS